MTASGAPQIARSLVHWVVLSILISKIAVILAGKYVGLSAGGGRAAFYLVGILCFLAYGVGSVQQGIWDGKPWTSVLKYLLDSALYAGISALTFWWLWP